jgi:hypothetical protein
LSFYLLALAAELFDNELDAARAYDKAVWRLKPGEAKAYVNFKVGCDGGVLGTPVGRGLWRVTGADPSFVTGGGP